MTAILMPQVGQDIARGTVVSWQRKVNDPVKKGEVILTVESEKASFDVVAPADGVLLSILCGDGEEAEVLKPVGYIGAPGEKPLPGEKPVPPEAPTGPTPPEVAAGAPAPTPAAGLRGRLFSSPSARRVAAEHGLDVRVLTGTGPGGRIMKRDVLAAREAGLAREDRRVPFTRMRRIIAERLTQAAAVPQFHLFMEVDMEAALAARESLEATGGGHVTVTALVVHAVALALRAHPALNAHVEPDALVLKARINIGIAVSVEDGLLVPVIPDADAMDAGALSKAIAAVSRKARAGAVDVEPRGTFTVSSLGMFGIPSFLPIINPPECALLAVGQVEPRVTAVDGLIGIHRMMRLTLACDHRGIDGARAARFLTAVKAGLEAPPHG